MAQTTSTSAPSGSARALLNLDNLLRRELKVGDPNDPHQIAQALSERYQGDARTQAIEGEAKGLPFLRTTALQPVATAAPTATSIDLDQARHDVTTDLQMLVSDNLSKDIRPELEGWQAVVLRSIDEGVNAARFGLDPHLRDKAFAMRRHLGEYARLARLVGALTPGLNRSFRNLAQSIDEACAVMLVQLGESMANLGFAGGRFLLQAPYTELQARRDAVLNALRQLDGVASMVGQGNAWPRGLRAYRQLTVVLEARGQGDLRSLMSEAELSRTMDELIQLASGGASSGLRAIGATAWAPLARLHRFVQTTIRQVAPASPELATLHEALQLFIDGFVPAGGFRLLRIARPAVLNYGLYGPSRITAAEQRLIELVNRRGTLARLLDCLTDCSCDDDTVLAQILLDKVLYDLDRAIDYYCVGDADLGLPEARAAAFSYLIDAVFASLNGLFPGGTIDLIAIGEQLTAVRKLLRPVDVPASNWAVTKAAFDVFLANNDNWLGGSFVPLKFAQTLHDELCLQRDTDLQWVPVVEQMTAGCIGVERIFGTGGLVTQTVDQALSLIDVASGGKVKAECEMLSTVVPPHFEESLEDVAERLTKNP